MCSGLIRALPFVILRKTYNQTYSCKRKIEYHLLTCRVVDCRFRFDKKHFFKSVLSLITVILKMALLFIKAHHLKPIENCYIKIHRCPDNCPGEKLPLVRVRVWLTINKPSSL